MRENVNGTKNNYTYMFVECCTTINYNPLLRGHLYHNLGGMLTIFVCLSDAFNTISMQFRHYGKIYALKISAFVQHDNL